MGLLRKGWLLQIDLTPDSGTQKLNLNVAAGSEVRLLFPHDFPSAPYIDASYYVKDEAGNDLWQLRNGEAWTSPTAQTLTIEYTVLDSFSGSVNFLAFSNTRV